VYQSRKDNKGAHRRYHKPFVLRRSPGHLSRRTLAGRLSRTFNMACFAVISWPGRHSRRSIQIGTVVLCHRNGCADLASVTLSVISFASLWCLCQAREREVGQLKSNNHLIIRRQGSPWNNKTAVFFSYYVSVITSLSLPGPFGTFDL
jgi:hypothetical protein